MSQHAATRTVRIHNLQGLHARPAELFAKRAMEFESDIEVIKDGQRVDAKSILHILTLGAEHGAELIIEARGVDAQAAVDALVELVEGNFASCENSQT